MCRVLRGFGRDVFDCSPSVSPSLSPSDSSSAVVSSPALAVPLSRLLLRPSVAEILSETRR